MLGTEERVQKSAGSTGVCALGTKLLDPLSHSDQQEKDWTGAQEPETGSGLVSKEQGDCGFSFLFTPRPLPSQYCRGEGISVLGRTVQV